MALQINTSSVVTVNAVSYGAGGGTPVISGGTLNAMVEERDSTVFGDTSRRRVGGLKDGSVTITVKEDTAFAALQALHALLGTVVAMTIKPDNAAIATSNPEYQFNVLVTNVPLFSGNVGDANEVSITWPLDTVVTVDTTP